MPFSPRFRTGRSVQTNLPTRNQWGGVPPAASHGRPLRAFVGVLFCSYGSCVDSEPKYRGDTQNRGTGIERCPDDVCIRFNLGAAHFQYEYPLRAHRELELEKKGHSQETAEYLQLEQIDELIQDIQSGAPDYVLSRLAEPTELAGQGQIEGAQGKTE